MNSNSFVKVKKDEIQFNIGNNSKDADSVILTHSKNNGHPNTTGIQLFNGTSSIPIISLNVDPSDGEYSIETAHDISVNGMNVTDEISSAQNNIDTLFSNQNINNSTATFGCNAGSNGINNTFIGRNSGQSASGNDNSCLGRRSGSNAGNSNVYIGSHSGRNATGNSNVFLGCFTGEDNDNNDTNSGSSNIVIGCSSTFCNTTGSNNITIGTASAFSNTTGSSNILIGNLVASNLSTQQKSIIIGHNVGNSSVPSSTDLFLVKNSPSSSFLTGSFTNSNLAIGLDRLPAPDLALEVSGDVSSSSFIFDALIQRENDISSLFIGHLAGDQTQPSAIDNTFIGYNSGESNTIGDYNTFVGAEAGQSNTEGSCNTFVGAQAGKSDTEGIHDTFIGAKAGQFNTEGSLNTFVGSGAGEFNDEGSSNTFIGTNSGNSNTIGNSNTFIGTNAGGCNVTGGCNTFIGLGTGFGSNFSNGFHNTYIGCLAGRENCNVNSNIFIGSHSGYGTQHRNLSSTFLVNSSSNPTNDFLLGSISSGTDNRLGINKTSASAPGYTLDVNGDINYSGSLTNVSDSRLKTNISTIDNGLDIIKQINPVSFDFHNNHDLSVNYKFPTGKQFGFIAQEIEQHIPEAVNINDDGIKSIQMNHIIPFLVSAVKRLSSRIEELTGQ